MGTEYSSTLLRRSYREGGKVKKETLANLSHLPEEVIELIRRALRGERCGGGGGVCDRALAAGRARAGGAGDGAPAGAGAAAGPRALAGARPGAGDDLPAGARAGLEAGRAGASQSTLGWSSASRTPTRTSSTPRWTGCSSARRGSRAPRRAATCRTASWCSTTSPRHYFEGRTCPLAARLLARRQARHAADRLRAALRPPGCPVAVEVFDGRAARRQDAAGADREAQARFGLKTVIVVGDRGMVTKANLELMRRPTGGRWITALKAPQDQARSARARCSCRCSTSPTWPRSAPDDYPGERLVVCRNPLVAAERARKREELLAATERGCADQDRVDARHAAGEGQIGLAVGPVSTATASTSTSSSRSPTPASPSPASTSRSRPRPRSTASTCCAPASPPTRSPTAEVVRAYKQLEEVERAFRTLKGPELEIRPIHHRLEDRVRAHVPLACSPTTSPGTCARPGRRCSSRTSTRPLAPTPSPRPPARRRPAQGADQAHRDRRALPQLQTLLAELATQTRNTIRHGARHGPCGHGSPRSRWRSAAASPRSPTACATSSPRRGLPPHRPPR